MGTYEEAMEQLYGVQARNVAPGLEPLRVVLRHLGDPQEAFSCIHIAGTNGKGSTAAMLDSVLRQAGIRTGLFTSPYLYDISERIRLNGQPIEKNALAALIEQVLEAESQTGLELGYFAFLTVICFLYFRQRRVRLAVIEVGLGGRLDPTNVLQTPEAAVITRIGLDHTRLLGNTVEAVAAEKGGIIKWGCPVVMQNQEQASMEVIARMAAGRAAPLHMSGLLPASVEEGRVCITHQGARIPLGVSGAYQAQNAATAIKTVELLRERGWSIPEDALIEGLRRVKWEGRFELIKTASGLPVVFDGAHNPQGMEALVASLEAYYPGSPVLFVMAVMGDKDVPSCIRQLLPKAKAMIATGMQDQRAMPQETLCCLMEEEGAAAYRAADVNAAIEKALSLAVLGDVICVCGSLHLRACIGEETGGSK